MEEENMGMTKVLPDECLSLIISLTSPRDACRVALVSHAFKSAADSDPVWQMFLPYDYKEILSRSTSSTLYPLLSLPKRDLYFSLCHRSLPIDNGTMSFQLEKENGRKCYMIGARALSIKLADNPDYWSWMSLPESRFVLRYPNSFAQGFRFSDVLNFLITLYIARWHTMLRLGKFSQVAKLKKVWRLEVKGTAELKVLSPATNYAAYLVFKMVRDRYGFRHTPIELGVTINRGSTASGEVVQIRGVILDPPPKAPQQARDRGDGWMEIEMGEFFNESGHEYDDGAVELSLRGVFHDNQPKRGLIIEGIELRPKDNRLIAMPKPLTCLLRQIPIFIRKIFFLVAFY